MTAPVAPSLPPTLPIPTPVAPLVDKREAARARRIHLIKTEGKVVKRIIRCAYAMVLIVALVGQTTGGMALIDLPWYLVGPAMLVVEGLGATFATIANYRRRLGEQAWVAFGLACGFAAFAVWVNYNGHAGNNLVLAWFFAVFSGAGFILYIVDSAFARRDQLWIDGKIDEPPPVYGVVQSVRHPWLTRRAKALAIADPSLGRTGSLAAAATQAADERRRAAIVALVRTDMSTALGPEVAELVIRIADPDRLAREIEDLADWRGMARVYADRIDPARLEAAGQAGSKKEARAAARAAKPAGSAPDQTAPVEATNQPTILRSVAAAAATSGPARATIRAAVGGGHPTEEATGPIQHSDLAITDAATIRERWPNGLPGRGAQRMVRGELGWHAGKATNALRAYQAQADLTPSAPPTEAGERSAAAATGSGSATGPATA